jgi:fumarate hydratase class II
MTGGSRIERDSLGERELPAEALYGIQTLRAAENFPVSGRRFSRELIAALALVKRTNAEVHGETAPPEAKPRWQAIAAAAAEVETGRHDGEFIVDIYQTGSGTSTNMNANEVIANRAGALLGKDQPRIHPNDEVNRGQSSNDAFPSAIHIAAVLGLRRRLLPALNALQASLAVKAGQFREIVKIGRTHLQDATPVTLGQEFTGYAAQLGKGMARLEAVLPDLLELPLGGTAVGTGLNTTPAHTQAVIARIAAATGEAFREADDHFEAQGARDALVAASGALKGIAVSLFKIANDIRHLASGPRCGIGELILPATQPGSSIMPGKVNPVQAEALLMAAARVIGNDATVALGGLSGNFELNVMMPVIAEAVLDSITLLSGAVNAFRERCVVGIQADQERCRELVEKSLALVTSLVPVLGYDKAAEIAKRAHEERRTIRDLLEEMQAAPPEVIDDLLNPRKMAGM